MGHPRAEWQELRDKLIDELRLAGRVISEPVTEALRSVPRHVFLPDIDPELVYRDVPFSIKVDDDGRSISSSSQPGMMAMMLDQLDVRSGDRVLEIGSGSGYNAALLSHLVGETGAVVSVDVDADLAADARTRLDEAGAFGVTVGCGDGGLGWPEHAPYDRIIATVGVWDIPPSWTAQLAPAGRMVVPVDLRGPQRSIAFRPVGNHLESVSVISCAFMRIRGEFAGPELIYQLGPGPGVFVGCAEPRDLDTDALFAALAQPGTDLSSGLRVSLREAWDGLGLWLALNEPATAGLGLDVASAVERRFVPAMYYAFPPPAGFGVAALTGTDSLAALIRLDDQPEFELAARPYGPDGHQLARRLVEHIQRWDSSGRPSTAELQISAHPLDSNCVDSAHASTIVGNGHTRLNLNWTA